MRFRTTLILLAILVALGAFVVLYERKRPAPVDGESTPAPTLIGTVLSFSTVDARLVRVTRVASGEQTELTYRDSGLWYITTPLNEEADQERVTWFVESLAWLTPSRVLEGAGSATDYDLEPGVLQIEVELQDGAQHVITLGAQTPAGSGYYGLVVGDPNVYVFSYSLYDEAASLLDNLPVAPTATPTMELPTSTPEVTPTK